MVVVQEPMAIVLHAFGRFFQGLCRRLHQARRRDPGSGDVTVTVFASNWPGLSETTYGPYSSPNLVDCRIAGRMLRQKVIFQTGTGRWGTLRADMMPGSWRF